MWTNYLYINKMGARRHPCLSPLSSLNNENLLAIVNVSNEASVKFLIEAQK